MRGADIASDHQLVRSKIKLKLKRKQKNKAIRKKFDIIKLQQPAIKAEFSLKLRNKYEILQDYDETGDEEVEKQWQDFEDAYKETAQEVLGYKKKGQKPWISKESWELVLGWNSWNEARCVAAERTRWRRFTSALWATGPEEDRDLSPTIARLVAMPSKLPASTPNWSTITLSAQGTASTQAASVTSIDTASTQAVSVTSIDRNKTLMPCPPLPPNLVGRKPVRIQNVPLKKLEESHPEVLPGGQWRPLGCISRHRVAIIIPYRDREEHLRIFLNHMHPFLQKQQLDYGIYIVEQAPRSKFNRAMLMNIGFTEASKLYDYQCYIFHDVDLLPEDDRNIYSCPEQPRHMSAAVNTMKYRLPYAAIFGGVAALKKEHFQLVNGFSNQFFGWGGEDDDLYNRIHHHHLQLIRYPLDIAKYTMMRHVKNVPSPQRFKYLYTGAKRFNVDGLNSLKNKYKDLKTATLSTREPTT
ncbi:Beta-1,4-N-acetylgalactosaminyltransferase bre-4 [Lamellibrachia satsuma]|nr:Beta-1,4-N-acetylgalactosaminyltransferase bre-4 [Lamellibrachia satsuma]